MNSKIRIIILKHEIDGVKKFVPDPRLHSGYDDEVGVWFYTYDDPKEPDAEDTFRTLIPWSSIGWIEFLFS